MQAYGCPRARAKAGRQDASRRLTTIAVVVGRRRCDKQFILHLKQFSDSLLARTQELNDQVDDLVGSVKVRRRGTCPTQKPALPAP